MRKILLSASVLAPAACGAAETTAPAAEAQTPATETSETAAPAAEETAPAPEMAPAGKIIYTIYFKSCCFSCGKS